MLAALCTFHLNPDLINASSVSNSLKNNIWSSSQTKNNLPIQILPMHFLFTNTWTLFLSIWIKEIKLIAASNGALMILEIMWVATWTPKKRKNLKIFLAKPWKLFWMMKISKIIWNFVNNCLVFQCIRVITILKVLRV